MKVLIFLTLYLFSFDIFCQGLTPEQLAIRALWIKSYTKADVSIFDNEADIRFHCESTRLPFADRAANGLRNLNPNIVSCYGFCDCGILKNKALDLINYLQAYDALKTAKYYRQGDGSLSEHTLLKCWL